MSNNRRNYTIAFIVLMILVFLTDQCAEKKETTSHQTQNVQSNGELDMSNYVDPYGITTCYPTDVERNRRKKANNNQRARHSVSESKGLYHYRVTVSNLQREWDRYEQETMANGTVRMRKISDDLSHINGTYEWDMDLYITDDNELLSYIIKNYNILKKYKVNGDASNIYDDYNNRIDEYLDDPEDEITFDPDIFNFLDD